MSRGAPTRVRGGVGRVGGAQNSQPTQAAAGWCERGPSRFGDRTPSAATLKPHWRLKVQTLWPIIRGWGVANYGLQVRSDQESFVIKAVLEPLFAYMLCVAAFRL